MIHTHSGPGSCFNIIIIQQTHSLPPPVYDTTLCIPTSYIVPVTITTDVFELDVLFPTYMVCHDVKQDGDARWHEDANGHIHERGSRAPTVGPRTTRNR